MGFYPTTFSLIVAAPLLRDYHFENLADLLSTGNLNPVYIY